MILRQETIDRFGYDPVLLTPGSNHRVIVRCECDRIADRMYWDVYQGWICKSCSNRKNNPYVSGKRLKSQTPESRRAWRKEYMRQWRLDPINNLVDRIRASMNKAVHRKGLRKSRTGSFSLLNYSPEELKQHLDKEKVCNICEKPLIGSLEISHRCPVKNAKTVDEIIECFALENLGWAHSKCNNHLRGKEINCHQEPEYF